MKKIYVVMASWNNGRDWLPYWREDGNVYAYEYRHSAIAAMEECYQKRRDECRKLGRKHIPRKYFKVIEFSQTEEIK